METKNYSFHAPVILGVTILILFLLGSFPAGSNIYEYRTKKFDILDDVKPDSLRQIEYPIASEDKARELGLGGSDVQTYMSIVEEIITAKEDLKSLVPNANIIFKVESVLPVKPENTETNQNEEPSGFEQYNQEPVDTTGSYQNNNNPK